MSLLHALAAIGGIVLLVVAAGYAVLALVAVLAWRMRRSPVSSEPLPPLTVLKPLCGAEPGLYTHLRSFCQQDYPEFQLVFGVRDPTDPALAVVERLVAEYPALPIDVVINAQQHGTNCKISNLINMAAQARHDVWVMADSDTWVERDYLNSVTAPLRDPGVGLVTCVYRDVPTQTLWSRLGAMYINEWYMPLVQLAWLFGHRAYASGQTLCLRREALQAIGGFAALSNHLADDFRLGELIRASGRRIVLSPYPVQAQHYEPDLASLTRHELRWMRTIHVLRPRSFSGLFPTFTLALSAVGILLTPARPAALAGAMWFLAAIALAARVALHFVHRLRSYGSPLADLWLLPVRDLLICWFWCRSFFTSRITWRGNEFAVDAEGIMRRVS